MKTLMIVADENPAHIDNEYGNDKMPKYLPSFMWITSFASTLYLSSSFDKMKSEEKMCKNSCVGLSFVFFQQARLSKQNSAF